MSIATRWIVAFEATPNAVTRVEFCSSLHLGALLGCETIVVREFATRHCTFANDVERVTRRRVLFAVEHEAHISRGLSGAPRFLSLTT